MAEHYYMLKIDLEKKGKGTTEIFLKSKGKIEKANYYAYFERDKEDKGSFPAFLSKGALTLTEITKKDYDYFKALDFKVK